MVNLRIGLSILLSLSLSACSAHRVSLRAPAPDAPLEERAKAFDRLEVSGREFHKGDGVVNMQAGRLHLGEGVQVVDPRDLLPVVEPGSDTANAVNDFARRRKLAYALMGPGFGAFVLGGTLGAIGFVQSDNGNTSVGRPLAITGLSLAVVGLAVSIAGIFVGQGSDRARGRAFQSYERDLLDHLQLERVPNAVELVPVESIEPNNEVVLLPKLSLPPERLACALCNKPPAHQDPPAPAHE